MIDAYASELQFARHFEPVWQALPEHLRGNFWLGPRIARQRSELAPTGALHRPGNRVLVASYSDDRACSGRRLIDMNHGAGQSYGADPISARNPSYAGGDDRGRVDLFLVPGPHPAGRCRLRWPGVPVVEIGCPALDRAEDSGWLRDPDYRRRPPTVAVCWHWECALIPETRSAFRSFQRGVEMLADLFSVVGHSHPRGELFARPFFERLGVPWADYRQVMERADVVVVDNSSIGFEAAACGKAVVWMTPPTYRQLPHGLRFGPEAGVGIECRRNDALPGCVELALDHIAPPELLDGVYSHRDGRSAERAAAAIVALEEGAQMPEIVGAT